MSTRYKIWIEDENFPVVYPNTLTYTQAAMESECRKLNALGVIHSVETVTPSGSAA